MGAVAQAVHAHGGQVIGVIPQSLRDLEVCYEQADELIITRDLRDRKAIMEARADAFLVLPGGFGTMEELFDALTLRQLGHHYKPIVFINTANFYDPLFGLLEHMIQGHFARPEHQQLYYNAETPAIALDYLNTYRPLPPIEKFA
jgi:uncharacterized protein (TIGR00730 family)